MKKLLLFMLMLLISSPAYCGNLIGSGVDGGGGSVPYTDFWDMDNDLVGNVSRTLAGTNVTFGTTTPPEGTYYAIFNGTDSEATINDGTLDPGAQDYYISCWVYSNNSGNDGIVGKGITGQSGYELAVNFESDARYVVLLHSDNFTQSKAITTFSPSTSTWYHIIVSYDTTAQEATFWVSTTSAFGNTLNATAIAITEIPEASSSNFSVATSPTYGFWDGNIDKVVIGVGTSLSAADAESIYDGGP